MSYSTDPRAARSREAMITAARRLLVDEGPGAITHQRVAELAGVGRATVYRHWPRPDQLLLDAMGGADLPLFKNPASPVRPWLRRELRQMADELSVPAVAAMALTLARSALSDPVIADRHDESNRTITARIAAAVTLAVSAGELTTDATPLDLSALLVGPLHFRIVIQHAPVDDALLDRLLDSIGTWVT
ncbi:TetR/AcrR family transcriptional regulator [Catenuloplanes japonicus]|uniref:TetR/AcrR family transcriptional regulator n=1 Tax=Catenuloplanes japonicus TaxID=33876 RepID=UPI0018DDEA85|nr:TetR/AcrR family transcriptional regulator [Catenuloplanes japonicus]